ncbi:helix-turn-helix transcriptional regulator [Serratia marcescens]|uniref:helix-turn-helix transcriptional regulator n=1 Tax=Serratia marcescens TaxID=615 RepID=UPI0009A4ED74|nr:LuxR C-terminal-related transcriptional regulator [Serratia marcescens]OPJ99436.1 hypothetical protein B1R44_06920 [Serratia marcescens]
MKRVLIFSNCPLIMNGIQCILKDVESISDTYATCDYSILSSQLSHEPAIDTVFVYLPTDFIDAVRTIDLCMKLKPSPRLVAIVGDINTAILQLICAMGVNIILSQRDTLINYITVAHGLAPAHYISPDTQKILEEIQPLSLYKEVESITFTPKETGVIIELLQGFSVCQVAKRKFVSIKTVSSHKLNALKKIGVRRINAFFIQNNHCMKWYSKW